MLAMGIEFKNFFEVDTVQHVVLFCPYCGEEVSWLVHELRECMFCLEPLPSSSRVSDDADRRIDYHISGA